MTKLKSVAAAIAIGAVLGLIAPTAGAQALFDIKIGVFPFPTMSNAISDIAKAKEFDKKNGLNMSNPTYGSMRNLIAALATGDVDVHASGVYHVAQLRDEGMPLVVGWTFVKLSSLQIVTRDPAVKTFTDLKGKTIAADMAVAEYHVLRMYGRIKKLELEKDIQVVNANTALARTQLKAQRVEAVMTWEPTATLTVEDDGSHRVILNGEQAWREISGTDGWQLIVALRDDYMKRNPGVAIKMYNMYKDAAEFINKNPDEADQIVSSGKFITKGLPAGALAKAVKGGRLVYDVQPVWNPEVNKKIWRALEVGVEQKYIQKLPAPEAVLAKAPN